MTRRHEVLPIVVDAIAEADGTQPRDLDYSLSEHIDTEVLVELVASEYTDWQITFHVPNHTVEIRDSGEILVDGTVRRELDRASLQQQ